LEDFRSRVFYRLVDDNYRILRRYRAECRWTTYLTTVITNIARDYRIEQWGRFRVSMAASSHGWLGMLLDTMIRRDGFSFEEAERMLQENYGLAPSVGRFESIAAELPVRRSRWKDADAEVEELPDLQRSSGVDRAESVRRSLELVSALEESLSMLSVEDLAILKLRFWDGLTIAAVSRILDLNQRKLYRVVDGLLKVLRSELEVRGVSSMGPERLVHDLGTVADPAS